MRCLDEEFDYCASSVGAQTGDIILIKTQTGAAPYRYTRKKAPRNLNRDIDGVEMMQWCEDHGIPIKTFRSALTMSKIDLSNPDHAFAFKMRWL